MQLLRDEAKVHKREQIVMSTKTKRVYKLRPEQTALTKQKILQAAVSLFIQKGFTETSIREVCKASGHNQASVFRYFVNKYGLCLATVEYLAQASGFSQKLDESMRQSDPEDPQTIQSFVEALVTSSEEYANFCTLLFRALLGPGGKLEGLDMDIRAKYTLPIEQFLITFCRVAISKGKMRGTPEENTDLLLGMSVSRVQLAYLRKQFLGPQTEMSPENSWARSIVRMWLEGCLISSQQEGLPSSMG
jgi:AcrR family transcriptional regulator